MDKKLIQLRLDPKIHEALIKLAKEERRSLVNMTEVIVTEFFKRQKKSK